MVSHSLEETERIKLEARLHEQLKSDSHILCLQAHCAQPGPGLFEEHLLLFPYCQRGSLQDELGRRRERSEHMSERRALRLFAGVCEGVRALHRLAYAHRDVKPANVLLDDDDRALLMDLGSAAVSRLRIATAADAARLADDAAQFCSMPYRPAELFHADVPSDVDERTDCWVRRVVGVDGTRSRLQSLGCLLYALCFFSSPFDLLYEKGGSIALAVMSEQSVVFPDDSPYSTALHSLVRRLLRVRLTDRPFIDEVIRATNDIQQGIESV